MPLLNLRHVPVTCSPENVKNTTHLLIDVLGGKLADLSIVAGQKYGKRGHHPIKRFWRSGAERCTTEFLTFNAVGFDEMRERLICSGTDWREADLSTLGVWQLQVRDPNGCFFKLNFDIGREPPGSQGPDSGQASA